MSHSPTTESQPGAALLDRPVGELVAERPGRSRIFQKHRIDFCCQGKTTLREACDRKGLDPEQINEALEQEAAEPVEAGQNPATLSADALCHYIVERHHQFLREELPRIFGMAERVAQVHGGHTPSLVEVYQEFQGMAQELIQHMAKEEQVLFPAIRNLATGGSETPDLEGPIHCMMEEHETTGAALSRLNELTGGYEPPPDACNTYRALFAGLADLETDLQKHIHLENSVLFPQARQLFDSARERT